MHCYGGRSRSAAFITAYIMSSIGWSYDQALGLLVGIRQVASINKGFERQLRAYYQTNFDVYVAQQVLLRGRIRMLNDFRSKNELASECQSGFRIRESGGRQSKSAGSKRSWGDLKGGDGEDDDEEEDHEMFSQSSTSESGSGRDAKAGVSITITKPLEVVSTGTGNGRSIKTSGLLSIPTVDAKSPHCRLSKPGSSAVRVIPPLRGLERSFSCSWCGVGLFCLANVIRLDVDALQHLDACSAAITPRAEAKDSLFLHDGGNMLPPMSSPRAGSGFSLASPRGRNPSAGFGFGAGSSGLSIGATRSGFKGEGPTGPGEGEVGYEEGIDSPMVMWGSAADSGLAGVGPKAPLGAPTPRRPAAGAKAFGFDSYAVATHEDGMVGADSKLAHHEIFQSGEGGFKGSDTDGVAMEIGGSSSPPHSACTKIGTVADSGAQRIRFNVDSMEQGVEDGNAQAAQSRRRFQDALRIPSFHTAVSGKGFGDMTGSDMTVAPSGTWPEVGGSSSGSGSFSSGGAPNSSRSEIDDSPRIPIPTHRQNEAWTWSPRDAFDRPQSIEKRRWLARVSLLRDTSSSSSDTRGVGEDDSKLAKMAEDDDDAMRRAFGREKYIYTEYLDWMGTEVLSGEVVNGAIACHGCKRVLGAWTWAPSSRQSHNGSLEKPIIRIHKNVVQEADLPLDATPASTPRPDEITSEQQNQSMALAIAARLALSEPAESK